jgi:hypothetical protein
MIKEACEESLQPIGDEVKKEAVDQIGHYQSAIGTFPAWEQLADATLDRKQKLGLGLGGNPDTPMFASGAFRDDIESSTDTGALQVRCGTHKEYVINTELGTAKMPPRPVFGPAGLRAMPAILKDMSGRLVTKINSVL